MANTCVEDVTLTKAMSNEKCNSHRIVFKLERDEDGYPPSAWERLWANRLSDGSYEIDNLPFYVRDISLGDRVSAVERDGELHFDKLLLRSRNSIVRVRVRNLEQVELIRQELRGIGVESELSDLPGLFAALLPSDVDVQKVLEFLDERERAGQISFEESAVRYQQPLM
jgi:hypothetical protein